MLLLVTLATLVSLVAVTAQHQYSEPRWISSTQVELIPPNRKDAYQFSTQLCVSTAPEDYRLYYKPHNVVIKLSQDDCQLPLTNNTVEISNHYIINSNLQTRFPHERSYMAFFWTKGTSFTVQVHITSKPLRTMGNATLLVDLYEIDSFEEYDACQSNDPPSRYLSKERLTFNTSENCTANETFTLCTLEYVVLETGSRYLCFLTDDSQEGLEFNLSYSLTIDQVFYGHDGRYPQNQIKTCHLNTSSPCCQPYGALVDTRSCVYLISNVSGQNFNLDSAQAVPIVIETTGDYSLVYLFTGFFAFELFICLYCMCLYACVCYKHKYPDTKGCVCRIKWDP